MPEQDKSQQWRTWAELASIEQDPERIIELVQKLTQALDQRECRPREVAGQE